MTTLPGPAALLGECARRDRAVLAAVVDGLLLPAALSGVDEADASAVPAAALR